LHIRAGRLSRRQGGSPDGVGFSQCCCRVAGNRRGVYVDFAANGIPNPIGALLVFKTGAAGSNASRRSQMSGLMRFDFGVSLFKFADDFQVRFGKFLGFLSPVDAELSVFNA